jgi:large subunit ribosomal protein L17
MRHRKKVAKLGRSTSHRKAMLNNLASALVQHCKIKTTDARAKELRRVVERLVTYGKKGTINHRRLAFRVLRDRNLVKLLFEHIAPQYSSRVGGYTRIIKLGFRDNDSASVSLIEFVDYKQPDESKKAAKKAAAKKAEAKLAETKKEEPKKDGPKKTTAKKPKAVKSKSEAKTAKTAVAEKVAETGPKITESALEVEPPAVIAEPETPESETDSEEK